MKEWKRYNSRDIDRLQNRFLRLHAEYLPKCSSGPSFSEEAVHARYLMDIFHAPMYFYGRYCKYARDVPQSPWLLSEDDDGVAGVNNTKNTDDAAEDAEDAEDRDSQDKHMEDKDKGTSQKGRDSIEEIVGFAVKKVVGGEDTVVKLHACGREDIDVRCLGNGRPFCLEILRASRAATIEQLESIRQSVNSRQDKNRMGDISLAQLLQTDASVWEGMQKEAEEKDKQYCCVVYTSRPVTRGDLDRLAATSTRDLDEQGRKCLQIIQKTPLRVLHRRSLLNRPRYIYNMQPTLLNPRCFLLDLATSAGAYVKEFVHGDLGRTTPSVSSVMNCQCEILQLDVTWLFDAFLERFPLLGATPASAPTDRQAITQYCDWSAQESSVGANHLSHPALRLLKQPSYKAKDS
eukprot:gene29470-35570_t